MVSAEPYIDGDTIMIPKSVDDPDGVTGIGWVPLTRSDPQYRLWLDYLSAKGVKTPAIGRRPGGM